MVDILLLSLTYITRVIGYNWAFNKIHLSDINGALIFLLLLLVINHRNTLSSVQYNILPNVKNNKRAK